MFIGAAGQTTTEPQRAVVMEVNPPLKKVPAQHERQHLEY